MITINTIEDAQDFEKIRCEWNELLRNSTSDCVFLTWEWLYTWWKHLSRDRRLYIVAVRRDGDLVAVAPFSLRARRWKRLLPFPALEFLGAGSVGSDYLDILICHGEEEHVFPPLAGFMARSRRMLELSPVSRASAHALTLTRELAHRGWNYSGKLKDVCPFADLSGHSWSSYLAGLSSAHRYNFRRRLRNLESRYDLCFERVRSDEQRAEAMRVLVALHTRRWRQRGYRGAFYNSRLVAFHQEVSRLALERDWLRLYVLRLNGEPAAALYGFFYNDVFYFYQSGFNPAFRRYSVGLVAMGLSIKSAIEEGAKTYDFLRGDESYKYLWARSESELLRLELYPPGERGAFYRQTMELRGNIKKLLTFPRVC